MRRVSRQLIAGLRTGEPVDFVRGFAIPLPVTVIAEVTVNSASQRPTLSLEHSGEASTSVPSAITSRPVTTVNWGTLSCCRQRCNRCRGWAVGAEGIQPRGGARKP